MEHGEPAFDMALGLLRAGNRKRNGANDYRRGGMSVDFLSETRRDNGDHEGHTQNCMKAGGHEIRADRT